MKKNMIVLSTVILVLFAAVLACGSENTGEKIENSRPVDTIAPPKTENYRIGEVIQTEGHTIVLDNAGFQGNTLKADFTVANTGASDITVSSMLSFEAKDDSGLKLEQEIFDCGTSGLDGSILPGDKLRGSICWSGASTNLVKIYYRPNVFGSGAIVWEISR